MSKRSLARTLLICLGLLALTVGPLLADDCSTLSDCEATMGYNMVLAIIGGLVALTAGLFGHVVTSQFTDPGPDRPPWSLMRRPDPDSEWKEKAQSWQRREDAYVGDRPEWSLMNRPSSDHEWGWDEASQRWRWMEKDKLYARRMDAEGYEFDEEQQVWKLKGRVFDPDSGSWREPLAPLEELEIIPEDGDVTRLTLEPGLIGYDESTRDLEDRRDYLEELEQEALDGVEAVDDKIQEARAAGDRWLVDELLRRRAEAVANADAARIAQEELEARVQGRREGLEDYERRYRDWSLGQLAGEALRVPWDMLTSIFSRNDPLLEDSVLRAHETARELRDLAGIRLEAGWLFLNEAKGDQPGVFDRLEQLSERRSELEERIRVAREEGDLEGEEASQRALDATDDELGDATEKLRQYQELKEKWARQAYEANLHILRKEGEVLGEVAQIPGTARTLNNLIDSWRRGILPGQYRSRMTGTTSGPPPPRGPKGLTPQDVELDLEHFRNVSRGTEKVAAWSKARMGGGSDGEFRQKVMDVLEDYQAKQMQKNAPPGIQEEWAHDVKRFRDDPLFQGIADELDKDGVVALETTPDGQRVRPVTGNDLEAAGGPGGTDLDIGSNVEVVDGNTLRPVDPRRIQPAVERAARSQGLDPDAQQIKYIGSRKGGSSHPEAFPIQEGGDASTMYDPGQVARMDGFDADTAHRVSEFKHVQAVELGPADGLTEQCRKAVQDYRRVTKTLLAEHGRAVPRPFENLEEGFKVMDEVARGAPPGTAAARFRELTGIDLDEGCRRLNSLQESVVKLDPRGTGRSGVDISGAVPSEGAETSLPRVDWSDHSELAEMVRQNPTKAQLDASRFEEVIARGEEPTGRPLAPREDGDWVTPEDDWRMAAEHAKGDRLLDAAQKDPNLADRNARFEQAIKDAKGRAFRELYAEHRMEILGDGQIDDGSAAFKGQVVDRVLADPRYQQGEKLEAYYRQEIARQGMTEADETFILRARGEAMYGARAEGPLPGDPGPLDTPPAPPLDDSVLRALGSDTGHRPLSPSVAPEGGIERGSTGAGPPTPEGRDAPTGGGASPGGSGDAYGLDILKEGSPDGDDQSDPSAQDSFEALWKVWFGK